MKLELETQFQLSIISVVFSLFACMTYSFVTIVFKRSKLLKGIFVLAMFLLVTVLYYFSIYFISNGVLSIYIPIFLLFGYYIYYKFYDKYFSCVFEWVFFKISSIILSKKERFKKIWIERKLKKMKEKEKSIE